MLRVAVLVIVCKFNDSVRNRNLGSSCSRFTSEAGWCTRYFEVRGPNCSSRLAGRPLRVPSVEKFDTDWRTNRFLNSFRRIDRGNLFPEFTDGLSNWTSSRFKAFSSSSRGFSFAARTVSIERNREIRVINSTWWEKKIHSSSLSRSFNIFFIYNFHWEVNIDEP